VNHAGRTGIAILLAALAACGPSGKSDAGSTATRGGAAAPAHLVPHARLSAEIPEIDGWKREPPAGASISLPAPASHTSATFVRGNAQIDFEITDTGGAPAHIEALAKVAGTTFFQKAANGYVKGTAVEGFPALESWNSVDRLGDLTVLINGRFTVHATGTGLDSVETLQQALARTNLKAIAALK
jgi:hypothetical protein